MANHLAELLQTAAKDVARTPTVDAVVTFNFPDKNSLLFTSTLDYKGGTYSQSVPGSELPSIAVGGQLVYGPVGGGSKLLHFGFAGVLSNTVGTSHPWTVDVEVTVEEAQCMVRVLDVKPKGRAAITLASPLTFTPENIGSPFPGFIPVLDKALGCRFSSSDGSPYVSMWDYTTN